MKRLIYLLLALSASVCVANTSQKDTSKPNIIWLMAEDMSLDLACYGMPAVQTPNLDKMAAEGVRFDNCFVTNSICSPSRSAMMVGVHQMKINAHNHRSNRDVALDTNFKPITYYLRQAGYTCILGHHGVMNCGRKIDVNFKHKPIGQWDGVKNFGLFDKLDTISVQDQPFFAQIQLKATHRGDWWNEVREQSSHPVNPEEVELPPYYADHPAIRLDWAKYLDQVEYMDNEVGMILQELKDKGLDKNTIVIFIGDNGRCNIKGKGYVHDAGLRIPFIAWYPVELKSKQVRKDVVSATDISATVLDYAGVNIPEYMTGKPLFTKDFSREYVFSSRNLWDEIEEEMYAVSSAKWKYIRNDKPLQPWDAHQTYLEFYRPAVHIMRKLKAEGKLNETQAFFFGNNKPKEELYNLKKDPQETHNLALDPKYSKILKELREKTKDYEEANAPVSDVYHPVIPGSVKVFEWVKNERPEAYQQMLNGVEIGFKKMTTEYKASKKK